MSVRDSRDHAGDKHSAQIEGNWLAGSLFPYLNEPLKFYEHCARRHGDIALGRLGPIPVCVLSNPRDVQRVLVQDADNFEQSRLLGRLKSVLGEGLLIAESESHARQRPLVEHAMHAGMAPVWAEATAEAAERLAGLWKPGGQHELHPAMLQLVSEVLMRVVFGSGPRAAEAGAAVEHAVDVATERMRQLLPVPEFVHVSDNREYREALAKLNETLTGAIREKRAVPGAKSRLLSALITTRGGDGVKLSDGEIRDQIVMIYLAVRRNLAAALSWTILLLAVYEECGEKAAREVEAVAGWRGPETNDAPRLVYCDRVVKESLRLYPPVWQILRHAVREAEVGGQRIQAGTQMMMSQWVLQRDGRFFDQAEKFLPERWENLRQESKGSYFPFGAGPRACFGESLSMMALKLVLATLVTKFRFRQASKQELAPQPSFALQPTPGLLTEVRGR
jgi:cytochrome P450